MRAAPASGPVVRRDMAAHLPAMMDAARPRLREAALYRPRSVVLVGDPALPIATLLAGNLGAGGFHGPAHVVGLEAPGLVPLPSLDALPAPPDLGILAVAEPALEAAMAGLAARGCRAVVVPGQTAGLGAMVARHGMRALGPNSFGVAVPALGLNATLAHLQPRPGKLALICQSSAVARAVLDWAAAEELGFSHVIGIGANGDLGFAHALDWLSRDASTNAVLLDLRRIRNRRLFVSAARAVARTRPVVALRPGGLLDDPTGTADAVMEAALRRAGVLCVRGLADLLSAAETLARTRITARSGGGGGVAIMANGRGLGRLAADAVLAGGGRLAGAPETAPAGTDFAAAVIARAAAPEVDAVIAAHAPASPGEATALATRLAAAPRGAPLLLCWAGQATAGAERGALAKAGLAVFATPEAAAQGALYLLTDRRNRAAAAELPGRTVLALAPDRATVAAIVARLRAEGRDRATEDEALAVLAAYGMPVVEGVVADTPDAAAAAAQRLGFPAVLKFRSASVPHKTAVGGVVLGLADAAAVRAAAVAMAARLGGEGFLVQRQVSRALELRMWLADDSMFGPWIGFGLGGTAAEVLGDAGHDLPPLNMALAQALIARTRASFLLAGHRDLPQADSGAVAEALVRLSQIAVDFPEIATLGVNPMFAGADGVLAADASLTLRPPGSTSLLAIPPYPEDLAESWTGGSGGALLIRPIRPEDAEALTAFIARLSPEDIRFRFFSQLKTLPPVQIARLTQIDYDREMAFCAFSRDTQGAETLLGVARLIREPDGETGEFAVIVDATMKGQGLGGHLMRRLFAWAPQAGIRVIAGQVLRDNLPMLAFVERLGFTARRSEEDGEVMEVSRPVGLG